RCGLGKPLGIALDHEAGGVIPDPAWKKEVLNTPWFAGETLSVVIGQGYVTVTPLQMAMVAATIANGGTVYRPHVIKRVVDGESGTEKEYQPEVINKLDLKPETVRLVQARMRDVGNSPQGAGQKRPLPPGPEAG